MPAEVLEPLLQRHQGAPKLTVTCSQPGELDVATPGDPCTWRALSAATARGRPAAPGGLGAGGAGGRARQGQDPWDPSWPKGTGRTVPKRSSKPLVHGRGFWFP